jgi:hypothetical protein
MSRKIEPRIQIRELARQGAQVTVLFQTSRGSTQKLFCLEMANVKTKFNPFVVLAYAHGLKPVTPMAHR